MLHTNCVLEINKTLFWESAKKKGMTICLCYLTYFE